MLVWEWFSFYRQSLELDVSLLQIKPVFMQLSVPETNDMTWIEQ